MSRKVQLTEFEQAMEDIMKKYGESARQAVAKALPQVGKDTVKELKSTSPKKTGAYASGWKYEMDPRKKSKNNSQMVVYNKDHYRLTHLLEHGHQKRNGGEPVKGIEHIAPAAEKAEREALELIEKGISEI